MIENNKSITMDHVKDEVLTLVDSLIVKLQHIADREETLEYTYAADEYICAITRTDNFHTYKTYSDYALTKAGLTDIRYKNDKFLIPKDKRDELVVYQREYVLATYVEKNNYYRMLAGLPNYGEQPLFLDSDIQDVDVTKPLHEMDDDDIVVLKVTGVLEKLMKLYPEKKYLNYLEKERRIPIQISRRAKPYSILYIKRDRSKQGVSDMFIGIYNQCSEYIQERFYEESYKHNSPYYDGFIGLFILTTTIQRYITNYFHKFINRDFYDKDIIKLFLESYEIPYYDEIPLSYMQKVAKNLNRLLMYKATDKVFTDIFKIFDLDNIDIYNYILFKDRKLDALGNPIEKYEEKTELGYYIETETYGLESSPIITGSFKTDLNNVKAMGCLDYQHKIILFNNGIVRFEGFDESIFNPSDITIINNYIEYKTETNFKSLKFYVDTRNSKSMYDTRFIAVLVTESYEIFTIQIDSITHFNVSSLPAFDKRYEIESVLIDLYTKEGLGNSNLLGCGENVYGQLGIGDSYYNRESFVKIIEPSLVSNVYAGYRTTFILMNDGTIMASGHNGYGQLGIDDSYYSVSNFTKIDGVDNVKHISCGYHHTVILLNDGTIMVSGRNNNGQLGLGDFNNRSSFTIVPNISNVKQVVCGYKHTVILLNDGTIMECGYNGYGHLGFNDYTDRKIFTKVPDISNVKQISSGDYHICLLLNDGTTMISGYNYYGQLGLGDNTDRKVFTKINGISNAKQVACGHDYTFILLNDGTIMSCGYNGNGQLGLGDSIDDKNVFVKVPNISNVKSISSKYLHSIITLEDNTLMSCGYNNEGQLGLGDFDDRYTFTKINVSDIKLIECGYYNTFIVLNNQTNDVIIDIPQSIVINYVNEYSDVYLLGNVGKYNTTKFEKITSFDNDVKGKCIIDLCFIDDSITLVTKQGAVWVIGNNINDRLMFPESESPIIQDFTLLDKVINVKQCVIYETATIFIINDGMVRYTGYINNSSAPQSDYLETNIIYNLNGISRCKFNQAMGLLEFYEYTNRVHIIDPYHIIEECNMQSLLYDENIDNPEFKYKYVKDLFLMPIMGYVTCYKTKSEIFYSGENNKRQFPFIRTKSFINELNEMDIEQVQIFEDMMYFSSNGKLYRYENSTNNYREIEFPPDEIEGHTLPTMVQRIRQYQNDLYVFCGRPFIYKVNDEDGVRKVEFPYEPESYYDQPIIIDINTNFDELMYVTREFKFITSDSNDATMFTKTFDYKGKKYRLSVNNIVPNLLSLQDEQSENNDIQELKEIAQLLVLDGTNNEWNLFKIIGTYGNIDITGRIKGFVISDNRLIIDSPILFHVPLELLFKEYIIEDHDNMEEFYEKAVVIADKYEELSKIRATTEIVNNDLIVYDRTGGLVLFDDFKHLDRFECDYIDSDYIVLYNENNVNVKSLACSNTDVIKVQDTLEIMTYEPVVKDMYNLRFVEAPISTSNLGAELSNNANYLDYELVIQDDKLWGGDVEQNEFVKEILSSEFNYVYSKYISVNSRYNLTQLNFEVCYMFRMLVDLKENEKYLSFDVPYVGEVNLFDCIVGLFAITCLKFGFDGNIMDTTTKTLSVLGFNFNQDMDYITKVIDESKLYERDPNFKKQDIEIFRAPKLFKEAPEVINLYLNNRDIMDNIYKYKYNAKTIQEYNAYKRIEYASIVTDYSTEMYKIDGKLPKTYMDYLLKKNINLYEFIKETDPENMVQQIDILLVSLDTYLKTDKFKYLFLNVPSLSMDNIRKFIYYLVDIFKSYTVDLKALNIVYHVDDKRIHNIKLILEEENFIKRFIDFDNITFEDFINYTFAGFTEFEKIKLKCNIVPEGKMPLLDFMLFNNKEFFSLEKTEKIYDSLKEDFGDFFEEMNEIMGYDKSLKMVHNSLMIVLREYIDKKIFTKDDFKLYMNIAGNDLMEIVNKEYRDGTIEFKTKFAKELVDNISISNVSSNIEYVKLIDLLNNSQLIRDLSDVIPFDMYDNLGYIDSIEQHDNKINFKDRHYFIRKE